MGSLSPGDPRESGVRFGAVFALFWLLNSSPSYYVNRDTLFCYHKASEVFLQRLMALYVASHYKVAVARPWVNVSPDSPLSPGFSHLLLPRGVAQVTIPPDLTGLTLARAGDLAGGLHRPLLTWRGGKHCPF